LHRLYETFMEMPGSFEESLENLEMRLMRGNTIEFLIFRMFTYSMVSEAQFHELRARFAADAVQRAKRRRYIIKPFYLLFELAMGVTAFSFQFPTLTNIWMNTGIMLSAQYFVTALQPPVLLATASTWQTLTIYGGDYFGKATRFYGISNMFNLDPISTAVIIESTKLLLYTVTSASDPKTVLGRAIGATDKTKKKARDTLKAGASYVGMGITLFYFAYLVSQAAVLAYQYLSDPINTPGTTQGMRPLLLTTTAHSEDKEKKKIKK